MPEMYLRSAFVTVGGIRFAGRISFEVYRGNSIQAVNKSKVNLYNLSPSSRGAVDKRQGKIVINAGYGANTPILFTGDFGIPTAENPTPVFHDRKGPDIISTIEMADGDQDLAGAYVSVSLGPGATTLQIIQIIKKQPGIPVASTTAADHGVPHVYQHGYSFEGSLRQLMIEMGEAMGVQFSIQSGALQIIFKGGDTGELAVLLNASSGLIGIPNKTEMGFKAKALLNPLLTPGRKVRIESKMLKQPAEFAIDRVRHVGDTHDNDWYSEIENGPIGGTV